MTTVGIVGAGTMGAGMAQVALEAGDRVRLIDTDTAALARAVERIRDGLARRAARLDLDADAIDAWVDGRAAALRPVSTLADVVPGAAVVIEAVIEDLDVKRDVIAALDAVAEPAVVLATNTSALSVAAIAAAAAHPERVIGFHAFNPVTRMALVEVVAHPRSAEAAVDRGVALAVAWGKTPIRCRDAPGFIVNRVNRPFTIQALRAAEGGEASPETIDVAVRAAGFPLGPFELMDVIGLDVNLAAATGVWQGLGRPPHLAPSRLQAELVAAGRLGRKRGHGFYAYRDGERVPGPRSGDAAPVVERILAGIAAEARAVATAGLASAADIDLAMRLGAGHPLGPFERERPGA